jgi:hypothetical protein
MARRGNEHDQDTDRSKIRVFYAEVEGSTQSLQEFMRTLTAAIGRPVPTALPSKRSADDFDHAIQRDVLVSPALSYEGATAESANVDGNPTEVNATPEAQSSATRRNRGLGKKTDRNAGVSLIPDLDFVPDGETPLKVFFAEKSPTTDLEQVLVLAYYLQHMAKSKGYGPGHILTAFKHVGKPVPVDLRGTIRNMKNSKAWLNFTDIENIRVTTEGENRVDHDLPRTGTKGENGTK